MDADGHLVSGGESANGAPTPTEYEFTDPPLPHKQTTELNEVEYKGWNREWKEFITENRFNLMKNKVEEELKILKDMRVFPYFQR